MSEQKLIEEIEKLKTRYENAENYMNELQMLDKDSQEFKFELEKKLKYVPDVLKIISGIYKYSKMLEQYRGGSKLV